MKVIGLILAILLVIAGSYIWLSGHLGPLPEVRPQPAAVAEASESRFVADGVLLQYYANDFPTFYLLYETEKHQFIRKELRFVSERGCNPKAGDLPCVYPLDADDPPVPLGSHIHVEGTLIAQRVLVSSVTYAGGEDDFEVVKAKSGESVDAGDGAIGVESTRYSEGCQVFVGCFDYDVPKAVFSIDIAGQNREITMVPGMLTPIPRGALALVWASPEEDSAVFVIAHGK